jgi:16S rRNA processing protein RimM
MVTGPSPSRWIAVARLLRPQGRRGELLAEPLTDLAGIFTPGREVVLVPSGTTSPLSGQTAVRLEESWLPSGKNAGRLVLKLSGCDSISQAEALAGSDLLLPAADLPALEPGAFFVAELLGCQLYNGLTLAGTIVDVHFPTGPDGRTRLEDAAPLLAIEPPAPAGALGLRNAASPTEPQQPPEPILVPFVRAWLDSVDLPAHRIVMHLPAGLLGDEGAADQE